MCKDMRGKVLVLYRFKMVQVARANTCCVVCPPASGPSLDERTAMAPTSVAVLVLQMPRISSPLAVGPWSWLDPTGAARCQALTQAATLALMRTCNMLMHLENGHEHV